MGKDNRPWRKLVKKLRRKRIRQKLAANRELNELDENAFNSSVLSKQMEYQELQKLKEEEEKMTHELEEQKWIEREIQAQLEYQMEKAKQDKLAATKVEEAKKIREEWEKRQQEKKQMQEEKDRIEKELKEKQVIVVLRKYSKWTHVGDHSNLFPFWFTFGIIRIVEAEEFDNFLSFLSGDIETPPLPYAMPEEVENGKEKCSFFDRTGVCLFAEQCSRNHFRPTLSKTILIPNFFSNFSLEQGLRDEYDTDMCLEYEDTDMYKEFLEFYNDVLPEFRKIGKVIQFKVCCNFGMHLRGNVYIQYDTIRESVNAYRQFNARFFNGKQLSLQFAKIDSWKAAICGLFLRKRCLKGKACNFLHVFRNPTKEFVSADYDWNDNLNKTSRVSRKDTEKLSSYVQRSRSRSQRDRRKSDRKSRNRHSKSRSPRNHDIKSRGPVNHDSRSRGRDRYKIRNADSHRKKKKSKSPLKSEHSKKKKKKSKERERERNSTGATDRNIEKSMKTSEPDAKNVPNNSKSDIGRNSPVKEKHKKSKKSKKSKKHKKEKKKHKSPSGTSKIYVAD